MINEQGLEVFGLFLLGIVGFLVFLTLAGCCFDWFKKRRKPKGKWETPNQKGR